ncbi:MAG: radical SAM protein [Desulfurococcales archaeon ex4484_58]|nr:MAG: radical SAM protein [Desulfurococcales archaeon ex4484_58]
MFSINLLFRGSFLKLVASDLWRIYDGERKLVKCMVCERKCVIADKKTGFCWNYMNIDNKLYDIGYGLLSAIEPRPIEIKPLFHYYPNSWALTFSGWGCNFRCPWCQNYHLSWEKPLVNKSIKLEPSELVRKAIELKQQGLCASFNEPSIHISYLLDVGEEAKKHNLYLSIVTNGYMTIYSLKKLLETGYTGFSIDIKGCPETYRKFLGGYAEVIYRNARYILDRNGYVEMVYLVIPKVNDWRECYQWIIDKHLEYLGEDIPLHINRYYPMYKYNEPPTPIEELLEIYREARKAGIEYVYIGNILDETFQDTKCPKCGKLLIKRRGYRVVEWNITRDNRCPRCNHKISIYGKPFIN